MTRRMSAILGEYSPAGQGCTRHFSVPPLEYKNYTSYKKYRPNFGLNIQESYGKRPMECSNAQGGKILKSNSLQKSLAQEEGYGACFSREGSVARRRAQESIEIASLPSCGSKGPGRSCRSDDGLPPWRNIVVWRCLRYDINYREKRQRFTVRAPV